MKHADDKEVLKKDTSLVHNEEVESSEEEDLIFGVDFGDGYEEDQFVDADPEAFAEWLRKAY